MAVICSAKSDSYIYKSLDNNECKDLILDIEIVWSKGLLGATEVKFIQGSTLMAIDDLKSLTVLYPDSREETFEAFQSNYYPILMISRSSRRLLKFHLEVGSVSEFGPLITFWDSTCLYNIPHL